MTRGFIGLDGKYENFKSIALCSGYWQYHIAHEDIQKTTFLSRYGLYEWVVMPMGLTKSHARCMSHVQTILQYVGFWYSSIPG